MYTVTLSSLQLYRYGDYLGWGPVSSITGETGRLVTFDTLEQAQTWIDGRPVFARDARPTPHAPSVADIKVFPYGRSTPST